MSNYVCWLCDRHESRKSDLKYHLLAVHDRLRILCPWCQGKELTFRKAVDFKQHVKTSHKSVRREASSDAFGEPNCFWLARFPKDYVRVINPTKRDSADAKFLRVAVEKWVPTLGDRASRTLQRWKEGWGALPLLPPSPSPVLDFDEEKPCLPRQRLAIHQLTIASDQVTALLYEEDSRPTTWYKAIIKPSILTVHKQRDSLLRRIDQVKPYHGVVPKSVDQQLEGDQLKFARSRLSGVLIIDEHYIVSISRVEQASFPKRKASDEPMTNSEAGTTTVTVAKKALEAAPKRQKTSHSATASTDQTGRPKEEHVFPLDLLLPKLKSQEKPRNTTPAKGAAPSLQEVSDQDEIPLKSAVSKVSLTSPAQKPAPLEATSDSPTDLSPVELLELANVTLQKAADNTRDENKRSKTVSCPTSHLAEKDKEAETIAANQQLTTGTSLPNEEKAHESDRESIISISSTPSPKQSQPSDQFLDDSGNAPSAPAPSASSAPVFTANEIQATSSHDMVSTFTVSSKSSLQPLQPYDQPLDEPSNLSSITDSSAQLSTTNRIQTSLTERYLHSPRPLTPKDWISTSPPVTTTMPQLSPAFAQSTSRHFNAVRASTVARSPSNFHFVDASGDNMVYEPVTTTAIPPYIPTPLDKTRTAIIPEIPPGTVSDDLRCRVEILLNSGCMPLLPPARRNWTSEEEIKLPLAAPFSSWPPHKWMTFSNDAKLMAWESAAMTLALKDGFVDIERGEILDTYNFLALPGSTAPQLRSSFQTARYFTFKVVRDVFLGKAPSSESNRQLITMLEAARAAAFKYSTALQILEQIEKKGISLRVQQ